jgi:hypothetical protein
MPELTPKRHAAMGQAIQGAHRYLITHFSQGRRVAADHHHYHGLHRHAAPRHTCRADCTGRCGQ